MNKKKLKIGLISSYVPKKCGIATYSRDLIESMQKYDNIEWCLIAAEDKDDSFEYGDKKIAIIKKNSKASYLKAAKLMNDWNPDIVILEHEFGLYGGNWVDIQYKSVNNKFPTGDFILELINKLNAPIITTLHTVLPDPDEQRKKVIKQIANRSSQIVTMTTDAKKTLSSDYGIANKFIKVIPHGVPMALKKDKKELKKRLSLDDDHFYMLITGLIGPNKGIHLVLRALPAIVAKNPHVRLIVVGQTHPGIILAQGESYRESLNDLAQELNITKHLIFVNEYLLTEDLVDYYSIADVYLTIHSDPEQSASGTLAYAIGCGLAAISTPYRYAKEVLANGRGFLVPFDSHESISEQINLIIGDKKLHESTMKKAAAYGKTMSWQKVGKMYADLAKDVIKKE